MTQSKQEQKTKEKTERKISEPERIAKELKILAKKNKGLLLPEKVIEAARDEDSILHDHFTWDNTEAAHQWRLAQARQLIRVSVEYMPSINKVESVFVSLSTDREKDGGYRVLVDVMNNKTQREILLADAKRDMQIFTQKYESLSVLSKIFSEMKKVLLVD